MTNEEKWKDPSVPHGTPGGYTNWGCRCESCKKARTPYRAANTARVANLRAERSEAPKEAIPHGTLNGYTNWGCRCEPCKKANTTATRERRRKNRAK